jgi:hypothetical protein
VTEFEFKCQGSGFDQEYQMQGNKMPRHRSNAGDVPLSINEHRYIHILRAIQHETTWSTLKAVRTSSTSIASLVHSYRDASSVKQEY